MEKQPISRKEKLEEFVKSDTVKKVVFQAGSLGSSFAAGVVVGELTKEPFLAMSAAGIGYLLIRKNFRNRIRGEEAQKTESKDIKAKR